MMHYDDGHYNNDDHYNNAGHYMKKEKNCSDKQVYDSNAAKVSAHNKQGCNIQLSFECTLKRLKSALQMHTGWSFGKQVRQCQCVAMICLL